MSKEKILKALGPKPHPTGRRAVAQWDGCSPLFLSYDWIADRRFYQWLEANWEFCDGEFGVELLRVAP